MTYHIKFTTAYKKSYKRAKKRGFNLKLLDDVIEELRQGNILAPKYRDHELRGNWAGFRECHIQSDWLLVYLVEAYILTLTLTAPGTHADIFAD